MNGVDDDGDGLIDLNDTEDCSCQGIISNEIGNIIPNPSFEEMNCCPDTHTELYCASNWTQATDATSDYLNLCGFNWSWSPTPFPDGNGIVGGVIRPNWEPVGSDGPADYYEYVGTCLESPANENSSYTLNFSVAVKCAFIPYETPLPSLEPIDLTIYGFNSCSSFPIATFGCPEPYGWYPMGSVSYQPSEEWSVQTINFNPPEDTQAIMIGAPCDVDESYNSDSCPPYFFFDDLVLRDSLYLQTISKTGGNCIDDLVLSAVESELLEYQWYHEGVALIGETSSSINLGASNFDGGAYQVLITHIQNGSCTIAETQVVVPNPPTFTLIAPAEICLENSVDTIEAVYVNGSMEWSDGVSGDYLEITEPGTYSAIFTRADGCQAIDSVTVLPKYPPQLSALNREACLGDQVQLFAHSDGDQVKWRDISDNNIAYVNEEGIYIAEAENECGTTAVEVEVILNDCSCQLYIPNSFSPNGDGINDIFKPEFNCEFQYYELRIFNRWGEEIFVTNDPNQGWNGHSADDDYFGSSSIYNYVLWYDNLLRAVSNREKVYGSLMLLR